MKSRDMQIAEAVREGDTSSPGIESQQFDTWYETQFKPVMERGTLDKYVARQAWFASRRHLAAGEAINRQLLSALRLAKDMFIANDLPLPHTFEIMDEAVAAAEKEIGK